MKIISLKITTILSLLFIILCKAQTLPLNTALYNIPQNAYLKETNNELIPYIGTYKATFQGNEIILYITKEENKLMDYGDQKFYSDVLIIKYIVRNSNGVILQDTKNSNIAKIELYSNHIYPNKNIIAFYYSGTNCGVGWGDIYLKKINSTQISWQYRPDDIILDDSKCPPGTDINIYLPETKDLIFTKQ
ncbi:MAG: hypothetical protein MUW56_05720 [Chryseobacterium sp.]|uniref:hypothetical protein n=1 Tax=Chryseobacterium sp. TaxID=1871047 RepID=UPI0025BEBD11|nr:hypothetical protein [Chryseobacterium sp.]MCJ7933132.1 hypothetical protein [Chryseobacterium sp.]